MKVTNLLSILLLLASFALFTACDENDDDGIQFEFKYDFARSANG